MRIKKRLSGFMGKTHFLLSISLFLICMLIPVYPINTIFQGIKENIPLFVVCLVILSGACLLPDLDNDVSAAGVKLGPIGDIMTLFMKSTSSIVWNIYHFKGDQTPPTQHRYLWHTPIIGIGITLLFYFGLPNGNYTIITNLQNSISTGQFELFIRNNSLIVLFIILSFIAVLVGSSTLVYNISKLFPLPPIVKYILPVGALVYIFTTTYTNLRIIGLCIGFGYLFHCLEDFFCDTGIPLIWPIPAFWKHKVWWRPKLPLTVTTGGTVNSIIDIIAAVFCVILTIIVFVKG